MDYLIKKRLSLKYYTTLHIAGTVDLAFFPKNKRGIEKSFLAIQNDYKLPFFILGKGSDVIIKEGKLPYATVLSHHLNHFEIYHDQNEVIAESGVAMSHLGRYLLEKNQYQCLNWAYGLPGSIGGGVFMNARVYGKEFSNIVKWVEVYDYQEHCFKTIPLEDCDYRYKHSIFQEHSYFIYRVCLKLEKLEGKAYKEALDSMYSYKQERIQKGQFKYPSAGSCFKNNYDYGVPSGQVIDSLNLRGLSVGEAKISEYHANFFVNATGNAKFEDFKTLIQIVKDKVKKEKGLDLELEVQFLPKSDEDL